MKALIGADDRILGFTAFGAEASEPMAVVQTAMLGGMPYTVLGARDLDPPDRGRRLARPVLGPTLGPTSGGMK